MVRPTICQYTYTAFVRVGATSLLILAAVLMATGCGSRHLSSPGEQDAQAGAYFNHVTVDAAGPNGIWLKTVGDLDGDGKVDLLAGGHDGGGLVWYQNPSWAKHVIAEEEPLGTDAEVGDMDGDGDNDVVALSDSGLIWYENDGWQPHLITSEYLHDVELADLDGDGDLDLVARNQGEFGMSGDLLHFYQQDTPTSWNHRALSIPDGEGLVLEDLDGDGDQDAVVNGSWYENTEDILNGPWTAHPYTTSWTHPNAFIATGDINGDGRVDIVLSPSELAGGTYRLSWFEAPTSPTSGEWVEHIVADPVETVLHFVGTADFDGDGHVDIATAEMQQGEDPDEITVYLNADGEGANWEPEVLAETGSHSMRVVDVDDDGDMDLYGANWQGDEVELWVNETTAVSTTTTTAASEQVFPDVASTDLYAEAIAELANRQVIKGFSDGTFRSEQPVMRQHFTKMIVLAQGYPCSTSDTWLFADVASNLDPSDPLYPDHYVAVCAARGITLGKTATSFGPYDSILRAQLFTMTARAAQVDEPPLGYDPPFGTFDQTHYPWARRAAYAGLLVGLQGMGPHYDFFAPATRGEVCMVLWNLLRR